MILHHSNMKAGQKFKVTKQMGIRGKFTTPGTIVTVGEDIDEREAKYLFDTGGIEEAPKAKPKAKAKK